MIKIIDKSGHPVEAIENSPVKSFLRKVVNGSVIKTVKHYQKMKRFAKIDKVLHKLASKRVISSELLHILDDELKNGTNK